MQGRVRCNRFSRGFPALGFAARFRKIGKNKTLRLLGIPLKLILFQLESGEVSLEIRFALNSCLVSKDLKDVSETF